MSQLRLLWQTLICFLVLLCCERLPGLAEEPLIPLLELRQEKTAELSWTFARDMSSGTPIDWVNMPANQDPFQEIHRQGLGSFKQIEGQQASGIAVVAASGSPYKYVFELTGKKYAVFSDGTTYSTLLPTTELSGATSSSSLETSDQESSFTVLAKYYSGFHYAPFRISQLGGCFGTQEESIALLDFIGLLRNPAIEKSFSTNNGKYSVRFPSFTEGMRSGHVDYTFDDSGALEQVSWIAGKGWSPSHTIEIRNEPGLNGLPWPREVHQVDWNSARALNYAFGDWAVPEQSKYEFNTPKDAIKTPESAAPAGNDGPRAFTREQREQELLRLQQNTTTTTTSSNRYLPITVVLIVVAVVGSAIVLRK